MARASIQRFQILGELGAGGMGVVYRARDPRLQRDVAIKVLTGAGHAVNALSSRDTLDLRSGPPSLDDLLAEARMMARLSHPNVLPIYEIGLDGDTAFLVMEYVAGPNLRAWLGEPRATTAVLDIYAQAARGILAAHACGIVHRDFKPDNVLIGSDGRARVADFGLSNVIAGSSLVRMADKRGTLRYMAPELVRGELATPRSDVFALCTAIVEAFAAERDPARGLAERDVPAPLRDLIVAGLAEKPAARPELARLVAAFDEPAYGGATNQYEIVAKLATGGMAEIFLARGASALGVQRHVVLKRVLPERAADTRFVRMFLDEARLAAQLQHPNIAQVYDSGRLAGSYFFTMEYVHGETVHALFKKALELHRAIPISAVLAIAAGAAAGLHHAHERLGFDGKPLRIVHRDVSPSNLIVSYEGHVKLVDFGIAKATRRGEQTDAGEVKGKISYMSPEQCAAREIDRRSDLFSLGIVMWELLSHERLFHLDSDFATMTAIVSGPVPPPSARRGDVPPELDAIVMRLLARAPADRFQTAGELHEAIEVLAARGPGLSTASLGRFLRELFGERPLPWIALPGEHAVSGAATLTSRPTTPDRPQRASA
ncbi:MAG TPA: serine/threonine-protein kinase, partial [Kofleriaceae bacterium]|nr:serine/threonine-protein kinase [Kofleriaceae bacterium]